MLLKGLYQCTMYMCYGLKNLFASNPEIKSPVQHHFVNYIKDVHCTKNSVQIHGELFFFQFRVTGNYFMKKQPHQWGSAEVKSLNLPHHVGFGFSFVKSRPGHRIKDGFVSYMY